MKRLSILAIVGSLLCTTALVSGADEEGQLLGIAVNAAKTPVVITECMAAKTAETESQNALVWDAVSYSNHSTKTATAIRFRFRFFNGFNELAATKYATASDPLAPGASSPKLQYITVFDVRLPDVKASWDFVNIYQDLITVKCNVDKVQFSDGSQWEWS